MLIAHFLTLLVLISDANAVPLSTGHQQQHHHHHHDSLLLNGTSSTDRSRMIHDATSSLSSTSASRCSPDPWSPDLQRRSVCPFEINQDVNEFRVPDRIARAHCLCEHSHCSQTGRSRCVPLTSALKVAYLDPLQPQYVVSTEIVHVPVACICTTQPTGRRMPFNRNIVL